MYMGLKVSPEYGDSWVLVHRGLCLEMDNAMLPTWWERLTAWAKGVMQP
jgi:hypothetical protein